MYGIKENLRYYFWATYRRKNLDVLLAKNEYHYKGVVLDVGGRDRGRFKKPKNRVEKWIFADIEEKYKPDMIVDITNMSGVETESIDVVNAIEIFEHVDDVERALSECYRVIKKNGTLMLSAPFLYPVHADPFDYERWTNDKWEKALIRAGFTIEKIEIMGRFFTVLADMNKTFVRSMPRPLKKALYFSYPILDLLTKLDDLRSVKNHPTFGRFHQGYFIVAKK
ncbi:methyltransferase domain-containing protein [Candidatus Omnitrophota bacterium]